MATPKKSSGKPVGRPENLKPFKKGIDERRNTTGLNKKAPKLEDVIDTVLGEVNSKGESVPEVILRRLVVSAKNGSIKAAELILDRAYGKAKQSVEHSGEVTLNKVEFIKSGD